jgi:hypothetical protein
VPTLFLLPAVPKEKEKRFPLLLKNHALDSRETLEKTAMTEAVPSPGGEGQDEGERRN